MQPIEILESIRQNIRKVIVGRTDTIDLLLTSLVAGGHVLLEDVPGTGKTLLAKSLAKSMSLVFSRIQFTPDLLPSDVTGLNYFDQKESAFVLQKGPVFTHILLADEINRATPRTQSSLLESMEEHQVTIDGETYLLDEPFFVIATQNPVETEGTYPLPEAQLDRFGSGNPLTDLKSVCNKKDLASLKTAASAIFVHPLLKDYLVNLVQATRNDSQILDGVSPRGSLALYRAAKAYALVKGRDYVIPEDIKTLAVPVLAHRLTTARTFGLKTSGKEIIERLLTTVPLPTEDWGKRL